MTNTPAPHRIERFKKADSEKPRRLARKAGTARYLGRSQMTLYRWMHDELLSFPKPLAINGVEYLDLDQIDQWLKARVVA